jgi:hypothetical protein
VTPGQSVVLYTGEECLGGARILEHGPTYFEQGRTLPLSTDCARGTEA